MTTILFVPDVLHVIDVSEGPGDLDPLRGIKEKSGQQCVGDKDEPLDPGAPVAAPREEVGAGRQPRIQQDQPIIHPTTSNNVPQLLTNSRPEFSTTLITDGFLAQRQ